MPTLWAFDLAARTGWAMGPVGGRPEVGVHLFHQPGAQPEDAAAKVGCFMRDRLARERPNLIGIERYLNPMAHRSADTVVLALLMRGAVEAVASCYGVPVMDADVATVRKHFCGYATAHRGGRRPAGLTDRQERERKAQMRDDTKAMVIARAVALGYLPRGSEDADKADASAVWDYFAATEFGRSARPLALN